MRKMLLSMPNLTELRLGTDDGAQTIEPWITEMFTSRRKGITLPQVKSLYVRMDHSAWDMHRAFPNLEAVSMPVVRTEQVSSLAGLPRLRVLHVRWIRWTKGNYLRPALRLSDIRLIFGLFPNIEHVLLEGFVQRELGLSHLAPAFEKARKLKKLAIPDQQLADFEPPDSRKRSDAASVFFKKCPTLQEICIGKQGLFEAEVIARDAGARRGVKTLKVYWPGAGLHFTTSMRYLREGRWRRGVYSPQDFAKPDDQIDPMGLYRYYEMTLDKCRTSFFDVEWLLATKPLLASRPGGPWYR
ncbi:hypothetical protein QBC46DRAFT_155010 [Diplogelasinospora grovesii]|uniref:Uncharacterized protein n=1 Tax=Diplogelasinospora grovesii TaxID=303347 RepID=A0AAN6N5R5_9PEZI|nr:hypothetical protein QBC46DRAFT_155010 [Diplogelasinospora grovesii]